VRPEDEEEFKTMFLDKLDMDYVDETDNQLYKMMLCGQPIE